MATLLPWQAKFGIWQVFSFAKLALAIKAFLRLWSDKKSSVHFYTHHQLLLRLLHFIKEFKHANLQHFIKTHIQTELRKKRWLRGSVTRHFLLVETRWFVWIILFDIEIVVLKSTSKLRLTKQRSFFRKKTWDFSLQINDQKGRFT